MLFLFILCADLTDRISLCLCSFIMVDCNIVEVCIQGIGEGGMPATPYLWLLMFSY
jgi:hypothetical protein